VFWQSVQATKNAVDRVSPGKWVWVTETGWPVSGANFGAGVASVKNARKLKHTRPVRSYQLANPLHRDILASCVLQGVPADPLLLLRIRRFPSEPGKYALMQDLLSRSTNQLILLSQSFGIFDKNGNAIYDLYGC
jgi:hypothetical protein